MFFFTLCFVGSNLVTGLNPAVLKYFTRVIVLSFFLPLETKWAGWSPPHFDSSEIKLNELHGANFLKQVPVFFSWLRESCDAVKLQKCFSGPRNFTRHFTSACRREDNDWVLDVWVDCSFNIRALGREGLLKNVQQVQKTKTKTWAQTNLVNILSAKSHFYISWNLKIYCTP